MDIPLITPIQTNVPQTQEAAQVDISRSSVIVVMALENANGDHLEDRPIAAQRADDQSLTQNQRDTLEAVIEAIIRKQGFIA